MKLRTVRIICAGLFGLFLLLALISVFTNRPAYIFIGFIPAFAAYYVMYKFWKCPRCGSRLRGLLAGTSRFRHCEACGEEISLDEYFAD